ncbi:MAG: DUF721 domain-containing protein [Rhizomicrobium sp.]
MTAHRTTKPSPETPQEAQRRGRIEALASDGSVIGQAGFVRAGFSDPALVLHWREIAGADVVNVCLPVRLSGGVLTLKAEPGAAVFLQYETRPLAGRINDFLGRNAVTKLKFVQGPLATPPPQPLRRRYADHVSPDDPVNRYGGPDEVRAALVRLARARRGKTSTGL